MKSLYRVIVPPSTCGYLPHERAQLEYEIVSQAEAAEYGQRMAQGWRRFGHAFFRPQCPACSKCQPIRVDVAGFRPNRSQRRCRMLNENNVTLKIGNPCLTKDRSDLYHAFHAFHAEFKGWPGAEGRDANDYIESFVENPFPTQEWCYYLHGKLIGVGYVDVVPGALSAIYFYYDPDERYRSPGTWNVLSLLEYAKAQSIPKLYLGYYVAGCRSMEYKAGFTPNEVLHPDGCWRLFRS